MLFDAAVLGRTIRVEVRAGQDRYTVILDGRPIEVDFVETGPHFASLLIDGRSYEVGIEKQAQGYAVMFPDDAIDVQLLDAARGEAAVARKGGSGPIRITAPMPGKIVRLLTAAGEDVTGGQGVVVMEAMKMENELRAPRAGRIREIRVSEGQAVETGALLALLE